MKIVCLPTPNHDWLLLCPWPIFLIKEYLERLLHFNCFILNKKTTKNSTPCLHLEDNTGLSIHREWSYIWRRLFQQFISSLCLSLIWSVSLRIHSSCISSYTEEHIVEGKVDGKCHEAYLAEILQVFSLEDGIGGSEGNFSPGLQKPSVRDSLTTVHLSLQRMPGSVAYIISLSLLPKWVTKVEQRLSGG